MRRDHDLYTTNAGLTRAFLARYPLVGSVLEPCAGPGYMADVVAHHPGISGVVTNDINALHRTQLVSDATRQDAACWQTPVDWVITNPPFNVAAQILPHALTCANAGVAFLLRLSYLEPASNRADWLTAHRDWQVYQGVIGGPRPNFRKGERNPKNGKFYGTDSVTVAWFVWKKAWSWKALNILPPFDYIWGWQDEQESPVDNTEQMQLDLLSIAEAAA